MEKNIRKNKMIEWVLGVVYLCALPLVIVGGVVYALFIGIPLMMYDTVSSVWKLLK